MRTSACCGRPSGRPRRDDAGFSNVVATAGALPIVCLVALMCLEMGSLTYAQARATTAARIGAEAQAAGRDPVAEAQASLSTRHRDRAAVSVSNGWVSVEVRPDLLLDLVGPDVVRARAQVTGGDAG